jgi:cytochrome o ubiquinol oxidase subunit 1
VWLHHFFTMGSGASVNSFFGITTMIISIPTGAKIFNWLFTMYHGRIKFEVPMLWTVGFMVTFVIGGMTGVLLAVPPADFLLHNSLFLIAHFHNVIIGGVLFGLMAGITYCSRRPSATSSTRSGASARSGSGWSGSTWRSCRCTGWASSA